MLCVLILVSPPLFADNTYSSNEEQKPLDTIQLNFSFQSEEIYSVDQRNNKRYYTGSKTARLLPVNLSIPLKRYKRSGDNRWYGRLSKHWQTELSRQKKEVIKEKGALNVLEKSIEGIGSRRQREEARGLLDKAKEVHQLRKEYLDILESTLVDIEALNRLGQDINYYRSEQGTRPWMVISGEGGTWKGYDSTGSSDPGNDKKYTLNARIGNWEQSYTQHTSIYATYWIFQKGDMDTLFRLAREKNQLQERLLPPEQLSGDYVIPLYQELIKQISHAGARNHNILELYPLAPDVYLPEKLVHQVQQLIDVYRQIKAPLGSIAKEQYPKNWSPPENLSAPASGRLLEIHMRDSSFWSYAFGKMKQVIRRGSGTVQFTSSRESKTRSFEFIPINNAIQMEEGSEFDIQRFIKDSLISPLLFNQSFHYREPEYRAWQLDDSSRNTMHTWWPADGLLQGFSFEPGVDQNVFHGRLVMKDAYRTEEAGSMPGYKQGKLTGNFKWTVALGSDQLIVSTNPCDSPEGRNRIECLEELALPPYLSLNSGYFPAEAKPGESLNLGLRLHNGGQQPANGVSLSVVVLDEAMGEVAEEWKTNSQSCIKSEQGVIECRVGRLAPGEFYDLHIYGPSSTADRYSWFASWQADTPFVGYKSSSGVFPEEHDPRIMDILVLEDQSGIRDGVPYYPYPFKQHGRRGSIHRTLFIIGRNLPQKVGQIEQLISINDDSIRYSIEAYPDTRVFPFKENYEEGWKKYYGDDTAESNGLQALLIRATITNQTLPGLKKLRVNGVEGFWDLRFGDLYGDLQFIREVRSGQVESLYTAYVPETIRLRLKLNTALPVSEVPVRISSTERVTGLPNNGTVVLRKHPRFDNDTLVSPPILLGIQGRSTNLPAPAREPGSMTLLFDGQRLADTRISIEVDGQFRQHQLAIPIRPILNSLSIARSPAKDGNNGKGWVWKDALNRAAKCHKIQVKDWDTLEQSESDKITNLVIFSTTQNIYRQNILFGQHAAMILMRDMLVEMLKTELSRMDEVLSDDQAIKGFHSYMTRFWGSDDLPINRIKVTGPDGSEVRFGDVVTYDDDKFLANQYRTSRKSIAQWRDSATREALQKLRENVKTAIAMAGEPGDCEEEDLLRLTGSSFEYVIHQLMPKMMTLHSGLLVSGNRRLVWVPDLDARAWIMKVEPLAAAVRRQEFLANVDTNLLLAGMGIVALPIGGAAEAGGALFYVAIGLDILDLVITSITEITQYSRSQWEQEFSENASIVLGSERSKEAQRAAKTWVSTSFAIGTSALGAATSIIEVGSRIARARHLVQGRRIARRLSSAYAQARGYVRSLYSEMRISELGQSELRDFLVFAMDAKAKSIDQGMESLSEAQRRAITAIDDQAARRSAAATAPESIEIPPAHRTSPGMDQGMDTVGESIELPSARQVDSDVDHAVVFETHPDSGLPVMRRPPPDTGSSGGGAARPIRAPPDAGAVHRRDVLATDTTPPEPDVTTRNIERDKKLDFDDIHGEHITLKVGDKVGNTGSTSAFWKAAEDANPKFGLRVTFYRKDMQHAVLLDQAGRRYLEEIGITDTLRVVEEGRTYDVSDEVARQIGYSRVAEVERIELTAGEVIMRREGGIMPMDSLQREAYIRALEELNSRGYVWLDNKFDNFAFEANEIGGLRVVILDTGGIVRMKPRGRQSAVELAREVQAHVNMPAVEVVTSGPWRRLASEHPHASKKHWILNNYGDAMDVEDIGVSINQLEFNPLSGERHPGVADHFRQLRNQLE